MKQSMFAGAASTETPPPEFLSRDECLALLEKVKSIMVGGGGAFLWIQSEMSNKTSWARTRLHVGGQERVTGVSIGRYIRGASANSATTRIDDAGLHELVRNAETLLTVAGESPPDEPNTYHEDPILHPQLWSDPTYALSAESTATLTQKMLAPAAAAGLMSAGTLRTAATGSAAVNTEGMARYYPITTVECSVTVRDPKGTASGWAGVNHYALEKIDALAIAARALDKCQKSANPSAIEPGRYSVVLEPQAVADLVVMLFTGYPNPMDRKLAEQMKGPFAGREPGRSKINERVADPRITISSDPMDPDGGFIPFDGGGTPYRPVNWIDRGVLRELAYNKGYALSVLNLDKALPNPESFRVSAAPGVPTTSVDDMIVNMTRGILVTRLSGVNRIDLNSLLCDGFTRDGLWLIEHGKISKSIKNFRFKESPVFMLNKVREIGVPQRTFMPGQAVVAPAISADDFSFVSLADAV